MPRATVRFAFLLSAFDRRILQTECVGQPIRIGFLWYLNVHALPPYRWQRCQALPYPNMIVLSWSAREDIGTIAALEMDSQEGGTRLMEVLCPFQLLYADGVERLAAESARERVRWVSAIW